MAYSPKLFSLLFLVALVSLPLALQAVHATREGQQYFAKASPTTTTTTTSTFLEEDQEVPDSTAFRYKAHQLYSNNGNSYYPTNTQEATYKHHPTAFTSNTKSAYETNNYQEPAPYKPTGVATRSKATANPTTSTNDLYSLTADELANYYSIDNTANVINKNHQNSKAATAGQENNIDNYYNEYRFGTRNKKSSGEQQATRQMGMSDTRFLGNGKYFYNINKDKTRSINSVHVGSTKAVYNQETYNPTATTKGQAWGNRNSQAQDDDEEGDEISP